MHSEIIYEYKNWCQHITYQSLFASVSLNLVSPGFLSCPIVRAKVYGKRERKESFSALTFNEARKGPFLAGLRRPGLGWWCIATCPCGRNPWGTPYRSICGEAPPERGTFFRFLVHKRVGISLVEVYERAAKSVFSVRKKTKTPNKCILSMKRSIKCSGCVMYSCFKETALTAVKGDA